MKRRAPRWLWFLAPGVAIAILVAYLAYRFPEAIAGGEERMRLVYSLTLLSFIGGSVVLGWQRTRLRHAMRHFLIWAGIGFVLAVGYGFRFELADIKDRLLGGLVPYAGIAGDSSITFRATRNGHFIIEADVAAGVEAGIAGTAIRFLVDTGASDVVLSPADAQRLGFDLSSLAYTKRYRTANGVVDGAPVRLRQITIGPISLRDVTASVNGAPLKQSLLGMSFLGRLSSYEVSRETLTLRR